MEHLIQSSGSAVYALVFVLALVEAVCIPFPAEVTFGFTAALAAEGHAGLHLPAVLAVGIAGELCGSVLAYALGRSAGRAAVDRWGRFVLLTHADLDRTDAFMARRGFWAVVVGRLTPLLRAFVSLAAGIGEMPFVRFVVASAVGTVVFCTTLSLVGYSLGAEWGRLARTYSAASVVVGVLAVVAVVATVAHRWRAVRAANRPVALAVGVAEDPEAR